jgi:signal transduction histidine kinase
MIGNIRSWMEKTWRAIGSVSIRFKIMGITLGLVTLLGAGMILYVRMTMSRVLTNELEQRGVSIARDIASRSADPIMSNNQFALYLLSEDVVNRDQGVQYALIFNEEGNIIAHSFDEDVPIGLQGKNILPEGQASNIVILDTEFGTVRDVAVYISPYQDAFVRVGMSEQHLSQVLSTITRELFVITLFVLIIGFASSLLLTRVITQPLLELIEATQALGKGNLTHKVNSWLEDEVGKLGHSFNIMTDTLALSKEETEAYNQRLVLRNQELATLNAIIKTVGSSHSLREIMENSLDLVLSAVGCSVGWICMLEKDGSCWSFVSREGISCSKEGEQERTCFHSCVCHKVKQTGELVLVDSLEAGCPLLLRESDEGNAVSGHVSMPLTAKSQIVGQLSIACHKQRGLKKTDLALLSAVGPQLGVAIENARLWEEVHRKEKLRQELLKKLVTVQEEERQRISRELHDELGQLLTSILIGLKVMESNKKPQNLPKIIGELKNTVSQTLETTRDLAFELRPSVLDDMGLVPALANYVRSCSNRLGLDIDFASIGMDGQRMHPQIETTLYRIVQESITNVARHSEASRASVLLERRGNSVIAIVEDNGKGFNIQETRHAENDRPHLGIYGIEERAAQVGGRITIESVPSIGTTVFVEVPMDDSILLVEASSE